MSVIHVLADGTRATDITGHIVKFDSAIAVYHLISRINDQRSKQRKKHD